MAGMMFSRVARNFIKNGYFPTDEATLSRIVNALDVDGQHIRVFDPCCGEGAALADVALYLRHQGAVVDTYGVEFDLERATHAKKMLQHVAHADVADVSWSHRSMGLLFLNPPYGDVVSGKAGTGDDVKRDRLEKHFFRRTVSSLQVGGVMVLIVPYTVLDGEFSQLIARNFSKVQVFMAPEQKFKQAVVFGIRRSTGAADVDALNSIRQVHEGNGVTLPETWEAPLYAVPPVKADDPVVFQMVRIEASQLKDEIARFQPSTLWPQFRLHFGLKEPQPRRPLRDLSKWHLALCLAAGQVKGVVVSESGRRLLVKGHTFKRKDIKVEKLVDTDGTVSEVRTMTDRFVPTIRGIDFTPGPTLGRIVQIG